MAHHAIASATSADAMNGEAGGASSTTQPLAHSVPVAARLLGIGPAKTWALIADGKIRVIRFGRRTLISAKEIERLLEHGC